MKEEVKASDKTERKNTIVNHLEMVESLKENWEKSENDFIGSIRSFEGYKEENLERIGQIERIAQHQLGKNPVEYYRKMESLRNEKGILAKETREKMARSKIEFEKLRQQYHLSLDKSGEVMKIFSQKWAAQHVQTTQLVQSEILVTPGEESQKFYKLAAEFLRKAEENAKADIPKFEAQSNHHGYAFDLRVEWRTIDSKLYHDIFELEINKRSAGMQYDKKISNLKADGAKQAEIETLEKEKSDGMKKLDDDIQKLYKERGITREKLDEVTAKMDAIWLKIDGSQDSPQNSQPSQSQSGEYIHSNN